MKRSESTVRRGGRARPSKRKPTKTKAAPSETVESQSPVPATEDPIINAPTAKPANIAQARRNIQALVKNSAVDITQKMIEAAKSGKVAPAKYLFELAGVHPMTEDTRPEEDSLAYVLLKRLGLPTEPVVAGDDDTAAPIDSVTEQLPEGNKNDDNKDSNDNSADAGHEQQ
jgi:hypothetical protein